MSYLGTNKSVVDKIVLTLRIDEDHSVVLQFCMKVKDKCIIISALFLSTCLGISILTT